MERILCTAYGDSDADRGITIITEKDSSYSLDYIKVPGKCNFCIEYKDVLYVPVQTEKNLIMEFKKKEDTYVLDGTYEVKHFYSHGTIYHDQLILASFSDGVDAVYDRNTHKESDVSVHNRKIYKCHGRSHYAGITPDEKYVFTVDNGFQQIYLYKAENGKLQMISTKDFPDENIRLMPYSAYSERFYLNTERTNRIYVLDYANGTFHIQDVENGANSISEDGKRLCASLRGEDTLYYYRIQKDGSLQLLTKKQCGSMPRDVLFRKNRLYVACTDQNVIEVYKTDNDQLEKISEIPVNKPVTFACI